MLKQMREQTKTILWITIVAFVGLIILVWGADLQLGKSGQQRGEIGSVNGESIPYVAYQEAYRRSLTDYRTRAGAEPDARTELLLRQQAWSNLVDQILLNQEARKRGIRVSDEEIIQTIRMNPPDFIRQAPELQTDGKFDFGKYSQILQNPDMDWRPIEAQVRATLPLQKLQMMVLGSVKVSDPEVHDLYVFRNEKAKVAFLAVNPADFEVDGQALGDADLRKFYEAHRDNYKVQPQARVELAVVPRVATPQDEENIQQTLASVVQQAREGVDFAELVDNFSEASPAFRGGPTGMYLAPAQMPASMAARAPAMAVGAISDPIKDGDSYHVFRVEDKKTDPDGDKFKIQDVQMRVKPSEDTEQGLAERAVRISGDAKEKGLAASARDGGAVLDTTAWFAEGSAVRELSQVPDAVSWAHKHEVNEISRPFETMQGWFILRVIEKRPGQVLKYEDVREQVRGECAEAKRVEKARQHMDQIYPRVQGGAVFEEIAKGDPLVQSGESTEFARSGSVTRLGRDPIVIGAAFKTPVGGLSPVLETPGAVVVLRVLSKTPVSEEAFKAAKDQLSQQLAREKQNLVYNEWLQKLRSEAKVEDYREVAVSG
jgi:parvulin-like peptidyl-prolyl isomerase